MAVEPFYDNIVRLHKAALAEPGSVERITLVTNALSDKRHEVKLLSSVPNNAGGQSLYENRKRQFARSDLKSNKYLVETVLLDDLVECLPPGFTQALLKVDIEGFEAFAFQHAQALFSALDIRVIFMEWNTLAKQAGENAGMIEQMIEFLYANKLRPYGNNTVPLERAQWTQWPYDIIWKK